MSSSKALSAFDFYDFIVDIIPGFLIVSLGAFTNLYAFSQTLYSGFAAVVFSFVVGVIIQGLSSKVSQNESYWQEIIQEAKKQNDGYYACFWDQFTEAFPSLKSDTSPKKALTLLLSYLSKGQGSRTRKFQSLYTFHRSLWFTSLLYFVYVLVITIYELWFYQTMNWIYLGVGIISVFAAVLFKDRQKKFAKKFVEYAIADFMSERHS